MAPSTALGSTAATVALAIVSASSFAQIVSGTLDDDILYYNGETGGRLQSFGYNNSSALTARRSGR